MPGLVSIRCPHCRTTLKLKSRKPLGRRVPCPRCHKPFVAKALAPPKDEFDDFGLDDEFGPGGDFDDLFGAPAAAPPLVGPARKPRKKPRKPSGPPAWVKPTLIAAGSVLALVLLIGAGYLVAKAIGKGGGEELASYVPADSDFVMVFRANKLRESPLTKEFLENPQMRDSFSNDEGKKLGIESLDDIDTIVVAGSQKMVSGGANAFGSPAGLLIILRANKSLKLTAERWASEKETHQGTTYYIDAKPAFGGVRMAWISPDKRTIVAAPLATIKKVIEQSRKGRRDDLKFVDFDQDVLFAYVPKNGTLVPPSARGQATDAPPALQKVVAAAENDMTGVALGVTLGEGMDVKVQGNCRDSAAAERLKTGLDEAVGQGKSMLGPMTAFLSADASKLIDDVVATVAVEQDGSSVSLTANIPASAKSTLQSMWMGGNPFRGFGGDNRNRARPPTFNPPANEPPDRPSSTPNTPNRPGRLPETTSPTQPYGGQPTPPPGLGGPAPGGQPPARRGGSDRVMAYTIELRTFNGQGDAAAVARQALADVRGIDAGRTKVAADGKSVDVYSQPGEFLSLNQALGGLRTAGFQTGHFRPIRQ